MEITISRTERPGVLPPSDTLGFGKYFTDHMFVMNYTQNQGWHDPRVVPYQPFSLSPATLALHYGQAIFEGAKAYKWQDGSVNLFRIEDNVDRLALSAERLVMPAFDTDMLLQGIVSLVDIDRNWVPEADGTSLYIRPTIFASESILGVKPASEYIMFVITSPVGAYYSGGMAPTKIWVEEEFSRVPPGGTGEAKAAGNYASSLLAAKRAKTLGFDQVLWLDAKEHRYVEEVGTMNVFFVIDDTLITPPLDGTILSGITRRSVLTIARNWGLNVEERQISIDEVIAAHGDGKLREAFGSGTAAVISQIGMLHYKGINYEIAEGPNSLRSRLYSEITGIQYGTRPDEENWIMPVPHLFGGSPSNGSVLVKNTHENYEV